MRFRLTGLAVLLAIAAIAVLMPGTNAQTNAEPTWNSNYSTITLQVGSNYEFSLAPTLEECNSAYIKGLAPRSDAHRDERDYRPGLSVELRLPSAAQSGHSVHPRHRHLRPHPRHQPRNPWQRAVRGRHAAAGGHGDAHLGTPHLHLLGAAPLSGEHRREYHLRRQRDALGIRSLCRARPTTTPNMRWAQAR